MSTDPATAITAAPEGAGLRIVDNFLPPELAAAMRADIDRHFTDPYRHRADTHQVWNYWFVPQAYAYFRTQPEKVIQRASVERFMGLLQGWSAETLGLARLSWPYLSFYTSGCRQGLHNDARNGRFAFVYSLTRDTRRSTGGETIVMREGDLFQRYLRRASAGGALHDLVEPRFNRLVAFDDRLVHGVQAVDGAMDPADGRFVLHGHIEESPPIVMGALATEQVLHGLRPALERFDAEQGDTVRHCHGPLVVRFAIAPQGKVTGLRVILDRAVADTGVSTGWAAAKARLLELISATVFTASGGETGVTVPLSFGGPVRTP